MAELADALDLGSSGVPRAGSIPVIRIYNKTDLIVIIYDNSFESVFLL